CYHRRWYWVRRASMNRLRLIALAAGTVVATGSLLLVACSSDSSATGGGPEAGPDGISPSPVPPGTPPSIMAGGHDSAPPFDGGIIDFVGELANALCDTAARCCFGNADAGTVDGGTFDRAACLTGYRAFGWENSSQYMAQTDAGSLTLDNQKAGDCLAGVEGL